MSYRLIRGDARDVLKTLPERSTHCVVTSPPYWGQRAYKTGSDREIGSEQTPELWVQNLVEVFREVRRVLRDDGTLWLDVGDKYAGSGGAGGDYNEGGLKANANGSGPTASRVVDLNTKQATNSANDGLPRPSPGPGYKAKDLIGLPWMLARALQEPYYTGQIKDERDRVWLAAMIDGEGCLYIHKRGEGLHAGNGYYRKNDTYSMGLEVSNTMLPIIERCLQVAKCGTISKKQAGPRRQALYSWSVRSNEAKSVVREVYPYLIGKQQQARIAYGIPSSGSDAERGWAVLKRLHQGETTSVDFAPPPSLWEEGWYLRSEIIWAKVSPMPQSVTDRPTTAHEQLFLFAKSGESQFWTHRDHAGTRSQPAPDYRWKQGGAEPAESWKGSAFDDGKTKAVHPDVGQRDNRPVVELIEAPPGWRTKFADCRCCGGVKDKHWRRVNLWDAHDYYYDAEAVREGVTGGTHSRGLKLSPPKEAAGVAAGNGHEGWTASTPGPVSARNARSVQAFAPSPFSISRLGKYGPMPDVDHYALMPISMATWCIKAGTSDRGCCATCGAPWVRQLERKSMEIKRTDWGDKAGNRTASSGTMTASAEAKTVGWAATCEHGLPPSPCTVLDPFAGAGTTMLAAERLGRNSIGCELSPAYINLAEARLKDEAPMLT